MAGLLQVLGITTLMITVVQSFTCMTPLADRNCTAKEIVEKGCPLGVAQDACYQCWICVTGFKEICGGILNIGGVCIEGLRCTNPHSAAAFNDILNQLPGICCLNETTINMVGVPKPAPECKTSPVVNPCTGEYECKKLQGEVCGGPGNIKGVCSDHLVCYPPLTDATRDKNSTCTFPT